MTIATTQDTKGGPDRGEAGFSSLPRALRDDVRLLGGLLGKVVARHRGDAFVGRIEAIRALAKCARLGSTADWRRLSDELARLPESELVDIARAFNQFLNLANIAEQRQAAQDAAWPCAVDVDQLAGVHIELVLTAHPTEVLRRTLIRKYDTIATLLEDRGWLPQGEQSRLDERLERLIAESWRTDEIRRERPTPLDEAKWGLAVLESSLWQAVPAAMRVLDHRSGSAIPPDVMPFAFASWMGGDRDGNPNVTAAVTRQVLTLMRRTAAALFLRDVDELRASLSMSACTRALREAAGSGREPYRAVLKGLRNRLAATRTWADRGGPPSADALLADRDLLRPLALCHRSLVASGMEEIANGPLLDTLRRAHCFGVHLMRLDIRQHADLHTAALDELTRHLYGDGFGAWPEQRRCAWLLDELASRRPLLPAEWPCSVETREVIDTCAAVAERDGAGISAYVVSMATRPSDVLAVALLLKAVGLKTPLPVAPLFETLADLERAAATVDALLSMGWYRRHIDNRILVMIGYSDSAKDAGQFAASWAQYRCQEELVAVAAKHGVKLTLFHGRGGTVGRGGGPSAQAIASQPPGSVGGTFRVTEQGEMIRFKLGTPTIAAATLGHYLTATLGATTAPPPSPALALRKRMDELAAQSLNAYRRTVGGAGFVDLFQAVTPVAELAALALGSRPARRKPTRSFNSLRAIPWVFAWTQMRLMLPAWLGAERAVEDLAADPDTRHALLAWPFFAMQSDLLEMVVAKADATLVRYYAQRLLTPAQQEMTEELLVRLNALAHDLLRLTGKRELLAHDRRARDSMTVRNTYLDPLHLLQAELLARRRSGNDSEAVAQALKVTMAGISSGLRNTG